MKRYTATLKYYKLWDIAVEANSLEEANSIAVDLAEQENDLTDINEREGVSLLEVVEMDEEE